LLNYIVDAKAVMANQPKLILAEDDEDDQKDFKINFHKDRRTLAQLN